MRWLRELAPQYPIVVNRSTLDTFQDETDLDQTAVVTFTSVLGGAKVNTFRVAKTWEHWWHGNDCSRAQGGERQLGRLHVRRGGCRATRRCARRSSTTSASSTGASTESQGPWDANYQIEDSFSWFVPGKKGDHNLKVGARYNYTELRRVSQINQNGTFRFNTDLPFDAGQSAAPIPSGCTIRIAERLRRRR